MKRTYIDANLLIAAFQGDDNISSRAFEVLDNPDRMFVVSDYLRLEVLPKPIFHRRHEEVEFMETVLNNSENVPSSSILTENAIDFASRYDLTPIDALHVGAAAVAGVDELITMEKPTKPMCQVREIKVTSLYTSLGKPDK